jgi:small GTP-binding protein
MQEKQTYKRKIVLAGGPAVGKTSLIRKYVFNEFSENYLMTIGTHLTRKKLELKNPNKDYYVELTLMIWDIMGQRGYQLTPENAFINAKGALLVCDLTRKDTLDDLKDLIERLFKITSKIPIIFMANKNDLVDQMVFGEPEIAALASQYNAPYYFSSAKTGENVETAFNIMGKMILKEQGSLD